MEKGEQRNTRWHWSKEDDELLELLMFLAKGDDQRDSSSN